RLLRGAALAIDGHRWHAVRQLRGEHDIAPYVEGLLANLTHASHDDVFDRRRIDTGALDQRVQHFTAHVGGMPSRELAVALAACSAQRLDDVCFRSHWFGSQPLP